MPTPAKSRLPKVDADSHPALTGSGHMRLVEAKKYTIKEAAKLAGVSESTMRDEVRDGAIPVIQVRSKSIIIQRDLEEYLQGHYTVVGSTSQVSPGSSNVPDWVENSPLLQPEKNVS